jgi:hypothetical protein
VVAADHRSVHPNIPGAPWWGAVLIAVTATAIGFAYDAGSGAKQLGNVFAALYVIGCVTAVLAVRQSGIFTAVVQPPLILFVCVPGAYFLFQGTHVTGLKGILIDCCYPLIERFLLMLFTSAAVLAIGVVRWSLGKSKREAVSAAAGARPAAGRVGSMAEALMTKVSALFLGPPEDEDEYEPLLRHAGDRSGRAAATGSRAGRAATRPAPTRSRHARPPVTEIIEPVVDQPRRSRATSSRGEAPDELRRRRPPAAREGLRNPPPRDPYERPDRHARHDWYDRPDRYDRLDRHERPDRYERRARARPSRYERPDAFEPYESPLPRRPANNGSYTNSTHHPISRVRYRGSGDDQETQEPRSRRRSRRSEPDSWEYDI